MTDWLRMVYESDTFKTLYPNLPYNVASAYATAPLEGLIVRRIVAYLKGVPAGSYFEVIKTVGLKGLFAGAFSRTTYCLSGSWATAIGLRTIGTDTTSLAVIAAAKAPLVLLSLLSNARQNGCTYTQTFTFVRNGAADIVVHLSFFGKNLLANGCLVPGLYARNISREIFGENSGLPTAIGTGVSSATSAITNTLVKPLFTGNFPFNRKLQVARKLRGFIPTLLKDVCVYYNVFSSITGPSRS